MFKFYKYQLNIVQENLNNININVVDSLPSICRNYVDAGIPVLLHSCIRKEHKTITNNNSKHYLNCVYVLQRVHQIPKQVGTEIQMWFKVSVGKICECFLVMLDYYI